jgi:HEAT repeat protein
MRLKLQSWLAAALALASSPAAAHLLTRGIPLSELAATSPAAVIGRVASAPNGTSAREVTLEVEDAVIGNVAPGPLRFALEGHHAPDYALGSRVLVFLSRSAPRWVSRQTALDAVEIPERADARRALVEAVRAYAGLRDVPERAERIAQLKTLALANLASASDRVRHEALLDLLALAPAKIFGADDVARVAALTRQPETPPTLAPGLVVLLAALPAPDADPALRDVLQHAANPQARAMAARAIGERGDSGAIPALRAALRDPAPAVRLTAQRALDSKKTRE